MSDARRRMLDLAARARRLSADIAELSEAVHDDGALQGAAILTDVAAQMLDDDAITRGAAALRQAADGLDLDAVAQVAQIDPPVLSAIMAADRVADDGEACDLADATGVRALTQAWHPAYSTGPMIQAALGAVLSVSYMYDGSIDNGALYHLLEALRRLNEAS